jgi:hypothetical protein
VNWKQIREWINPPEDIPETMWIKKGGVEYCEKGIHQWESISRNGVWKLQCMTCGQQSIAPEKKQNETDNQPNS